MEQSIEKRLSDLITQIELIYTDYNNNDTNSKKIQSYRKCDVLLKQAKNLIEELKIEIINLDQTFALNEIDPSQTNRIETLIDLLQMPNTNFDSVVKIYRELKMIYAGIPTTITIVDNVENEVVYDDLELEI